MCSPSRPHDERDLGVNFVAHEAINDMHAVFLQLARPLDVVGLVKSRAQFHHRRDLLAVVHGVHQRADDARVAAGAVERHFDGEHVVVRGGVFQKFHDAAE